MVCALILLIDFAQLPSTGLVLISHQRFEVLRLVNSNVLEYVFMHQIVMQKAYSMCGFESTIRNVTAVLPKSAGDPLSPGFM